MIIFIPCLIDFQVKKDSVEMISQVYLWKRRADTFKCMQTSGTHTEVTIAFISLTAFLIAQCVPLIFLVIKVIEVIILYLNMQLNTLHRGFTEPGHQK